MYGKIPRRSDYDLPQFPDPNQAVAQTSHQIGHLRIATHEMSPSSPPLPPKEPIAGPSSDRDPPFFPDRTKPANPLTDLIDTESEYVDLLARVIRRVAAAWSRSNFPPMVLDRMFRAIEACYKINKMLLARLNEIGPSPASPKALGDLLMRWIDEIESAYQTYASAFRCDFDNYEPVQNNPRLHPILDALPTGFTTLDSLFILPNTRLRYYKRLYTKLLRSTEEGRSDHKLLSQANAKLDMLLAACAETQDIPATADAETPSSGGTELTAESISSQPSPAAFKNLPPEPTTPTGSRPSSRIAGHDLVSPSPRGSSAQASPVKLQASPIRLDPSRQLNPITDFGDRFTSQNVATQVAHQPGHRSTDSQVTVTSSSAATNSLRGSKSGSDKTASSSRTSSWQSRNEAARSSSSLAKIGSAEHETGFEQPEDEGSAALRSSKTVRHPTKRMSSLTSGIRVAGAADLESLLDTTRTLDLFTMKPKINPSSLPFSRQLLFHGDVAFTFRLSIDAVRQRESMQEDATAWPTIMNVSKAHIFLLTDLFLICEYSYDVSGQLCVHLLFPPLAGKHLRIRAVEEDSDGREFDIIVMKREVLSVTCNNSQDRNRWLAYFDQCITHGSQVNLRVNMDTLRAADPSGLSAPDQAHALQNGAIYSPLGRTVSPTNSSDNDRITGSPRPPIREPVMPASPKYHNGYNNQLQSTSQSRSLSGPVGGVGHLEQSHNHSLPSNLKANSQQRSGYREQQFTWNDRPQSEQGYDEFGRPTLQRRPTASSLPPGAAPPGAMSQRGPLRPYDRNSAPYQITRDPEQVLRKEGSRSVGSLRDYAHEQDISAPPVPYDARFSQPVYDQRRGPPVVPSQSMDLPRPVANRRLDDDDSPPATPTERQPVTSQVVAQMKCKVFLQTSHQQWKSLGTSRLTLYLQSPGNLKQLVVQNDNNSKATLISTIILTDGVERVGRTGVAIELSDNGARTGIVYMLQLKTEQSALGFYKQLLLGSTRQSASS